MESPENKMPTIKKICFSSLLFVVANVDSLGRKRRKEKRAVYLKESAALNRKQRQQWLGDGTDERKWVTALFTFLSQHCDITLGRTFQMNEPSCTFSIERPAFFPAVFSFPLDHPFSAVPAV